MKEWSRGGAKVAEKELVWKRIWFVGRNVALRFYQSVWQIAVVGQSEGMMWVVSDLQFCVGCY